MSTAAGPSQQALPTSTANNTSCAFTQSRGRCTCPEQCHQGLERLAMQLCAIADTPTTQILMPPRCAAILISRACTRHRAIQLHGRRLQSLCAICIAQLLPAFCMMRAQHRARTQQPGQQIVKSLRKIASSSGAGTRRDHLGHSATLFMPAQSNPPLARASAPCASALPTARPDQASTSGRPRSVRLAGLCCCG